MAKTLEAKEQQVLKIFSDDYVFRIPSYQRPYSWKAEQAQSLLNDLLSSLTTAGGSVEQMPPYFLGSIVLIKSDAGPDAEVLDGQQRLTTLTILLAAIRANVDEKTAADITPLLYEKGASIRGTRDRFRLTLRERDTAFFQNYIQREDGFSALLKLEDQLPDSQANVRDNARLYQHRLATLPEKDRVRLAEFLNTRCYLVVVATPDFDAAYRIFSVLNSRGLPLHPTDILKADVLGAIPVAEREAYTKKWEDSEVDLGREAFNELFSHIRMVYRRAKSQGTLLKEFKDHVTELAEPTRLIDCVLLPMAQAFGEIREEAYLSTTGERLVNEHLKWLNQLDFTDWIPPALAFTIRHRNDGAAMATFFRELERLAFGLAIQRAGINDRIERFSRLTKAIDLKADLSAPDSPLELTPSEQTEISQHLAGDFYQSFNATTRRSILLRLDSLLSSGEAKYIYSKISVEHVLPQTPTGDMWRQWFPEPELRAQWVHKLGNLALLSHRKNSSASNYEFDKKKETYFSSSEACPFVLTTQVLQQTVWTPEVIADRQRHLLGVLEKHWRLAKPELAAATAG